MALTSEAARLSVIAFQRFGLGAKPGGMSRIGSAPKAALRAEVATPGISLISNAALPTYSRATYNAMLGFTQAEAMRREEIDARIDKHMAVEIGFVERLVLFWSNHFSMSAKHSAIVRGTIGQFERDVIRKHALGRFSNMLRSAIRHPAMVGFLDNDSSIGPGSPVGYKRRVSYTENLAREILELHTVGTGNYANADVAALAKMLTGWSYVRAWEANNNMNGGSDQNRGRFIFRPDWHEQGPIQFMGQVYPNEGLLQADRALLRLAAHPQTAQHLALKLVRHFISDKPTPAMVSPIKQAYLQSGGDLKAVALALLDLPDAWSGQLTRIRTPYEVSVAQFRALRTRYTAEEVWGFDRTLSALHQPIWQCPTPDGFSDETLQWLTPDAIAVRVDTAMRAAQVYGKRLTMGVPALGQSLYDAALSSATRERLHGAGSPTAALTILFSSPEFQRR